MPGRNALVAVLAGFASVAAGCTFDDSNAGQGDSEQVADASRALFDASVVHDIDISFEQSAYDELIATFAETGEKTWIEATVTIDGERYERAGLRLKGNSSLAGLGGGFGGGFGGRGPGGAGAGASADATEPAGLPWLIRLDEYVDGQDHQGYEDVVIRSNGTETSLNEAVASALLDQAGLAAQATAATRFSINGSAAQLRLASEHPDDDAWQESAFEGQGALYKAESTGDWSYRGDDPASYEEVFDQEGGKDVADLSPLIEFLQFINESDDETFGTDLDQHLDVDAFATYLAMMELVGNFDDIDGPGNNSYLWYDLATGVFTVVPWDMNLAFNVGPGGQGGGPGGQGGAPQGFELPADGELPEEFEPPEGFEPPADGELPEGFEPRQGIPGGEGFGRSNILVERFHANADFEATYQARLAELSTQLFESGDAQAVLDAWVALLSDQATDVVSQSAIDEDAAAIAEQL